MRNIFHRFIVRALQTINMSTVSINGRTYQGRNVSMVNGRIIIDGKDVTEDAKDDREINVSIEGNVNSLSVGHCVNLKINGECGSVSTTSGDVKCGTIKGSVRTVSGDVECENVGGSVETVSGDVTCGDINGNAKTLSGDISHN